MFVFGVGESGGNILLEKTYDAGELLDRDFRVDAGRIFQVLVCRLEDGRNELFPGDDGAEAVIRRSKTAIHDDVDTVGSSAGVGVGILLPCADSLQLEESAADITEEHFAIAGFRFRELLGVEGRDALFELAEGTHLLINSSPRIIFQECVVLMKPGGSSRGWGEFEKDVVLEIVNEGIPIGGWLCGAGGARGSCRAGGCRPKECSSN